MSPILGFFKVFGCFWSLLLLAKFRGYIRSEMPFSRQNMKIGCLGHVWVPSVLRRKSRAYPLKIELKIFEFSTIQIFGIFSSVCKGFPSNALKNGTLHILRPRALHRAIKDTQKWLSDKLNWAVFDHD